MFLLHERITESGAYEKTHLDINGDLVRVYVDGLPNGNLPVRALEMVMKRYGKPLADEVLLDGLPELSLGGGRSLRMLRHRARYDVTARDFLVFEAPGAEPIAELATGVTAALFHLLRASL